MKNHLSPKEFGDTTGVSESSVKRWIDGGTIEAERTAGGHRRIRVDEAVRYIREHRLTVLKPQLLGLAEVDTVGREVTDGPLARGALSQALQAGLGPQVRGIILSLFLAGHSVAAIADGPIAGAMHEIGELWKRSKAGIFIEHRATDLCIAAISQLRALLPAPAEDAPYAVGGAPEDDPYLIPSALAAATLAADGWHTVSLGPQTPLHILQLAAGEHQARITWLSVTSPVTDASFHKPIEQLAGHLAARDGYLVLGGQELPRPFKASSPNLHIAYTMGELAAFARGLRQRHDRGTDVDAPRQASEV